MPDLIHILMPDQSIRSVEVQSNEMSIGRAADNDIVLDHPSVSRAHARLGGIVEAFAVARRAMRIVRQNFAWALVYNLVALPLAAVGWIGPWQAALGMAASSFIVVLNAMRPLAPSEPWKASTSSSRSRSFSYS